MTYHFDRVCVEWLSVAERYQLSSCMKAGRVPNCDADGWLDNITLNCGQPRCECGLALHRELKLCSSVDER
jgi:hypothetical protein